MDTHVPFATVREALLFSAKLRQPASVSLAEKEAYVEKCLKMCGLEAYGEASVGSLSVEHRKRTTIAVELAARVHIPLIFQRDFYLTSTLSPNCSSSWTSPLLGWTLRVPGLSCHSYAPSPITAKPFFARKFSLYLIPTSPLTIPLSEFIKYVTTQSSKPRCANLSFKPSAELFQVFDRLLLLRKGGQTVYFGDLGRNATTLINYFERNGGRHCDPIENP